jgi:hypothetical protein
MQTTSTYGNPVGVAKPPDNVVTPDPTQAAADTQAQALTDLYNQLTALQRTTTR